MSVIDKDKVDGIGISKDHTKVILMISDHISWEKEYDHLLILQDKINAYVNFIESGQARNMYPDIDVYTIMIYFKYEITLNVKEFLTAINKQLKGIGINIDFQEESKSNF